MIFERRGEPRVVNIQLKPFAHIFAKSVSLFLEQRPESTRERRRLHETHGHFRRVRVTHGSVLKTNPYIFQTRVNGEATQLIDRIESERRIEGILRLGAKKSANAIDDRGMEYLPVEGSPHVEGDSTAWSENPSHFFHGSEAIREILQSLLAQNNIEAGVHEGQRSCAAELPLDKRVFSRRVEHRLVDINTNDLAFGLANDINPARDESGSTGDVKNPISGLA
jgi:hypothetical protein